MVAHDEAESAKYQGQAKPKREMDVSDERNAQKDEAKQGVLAIGEPASEHLTTTGAIDRIVFRSEDEQYVVATLKREGLLA